MERLKNFSKHKYSMIIPFMLLFAVVGTVLLLSSHAATPYINVAASSGTLGGNASLKTDASGEQYVQFGGVPSSGGSGGGSSAFQAGLGMRIWKTNDTNVANAVHPKLVRFELSTGDANTSSTAGSGWVDFYAGLGAQPQPLVDFNGIPDAATVSSVAAWGKQEASKIKLIEWGNEDGCTYKYNDQPGSSTYEARARAYATSVKELSQGLAGSGVGIIAQADDCGTGSPDWVNQMFATVPDLQSYVTGWTIHPYGTDYIAHINRLISQVGAHISPVKPLYITEWGLASDNGRTLSDNYHWPTNMTYQQAAGTLMGGTGNLSSNPNGVVGDIIANEKTVAEFILYQSSDQAVSGTSTNREDYFGAVALTSTSGSVTNKGPYTTAVANLLSKY